jgi:hypothetical protein
LLTVPGCVTLENAVNLQVPRCIKLMIFGSVHLCSATRDVGPNCEDIGWKVSSEKHPTTANWPVDHDFCVHEFVVQDYLWMIGNFGGASVMTTDE